MHDGAGQVERQEGIAVLQSPGDEIVQGGDAEDVGIVLQNDGRTAVPFEDRAQDGIVVGDVGGAVRLSVPGTGVPVEIAVTHVLHDLGEPGDDAGIEKADAKKSAKKASSLA